GELDLWGRVRRSIESNEASAQASAGDLGAAKLSAQTELAQDYLLLRVQDATLRLLNDTVGAYERSLQLSRNQYAAGVAGRSDVVQAETQLKSTQALALDAGIQRAQLEHAIAILIGKAPAEFSLPAVQFDATFPEIPTGLPSELLERRQDVEDNLAALRILEQEASVQDEAVKAARESLAIVLNQYRAGTANYLAVIVIQAAALSNERSSITILGRRLTASVALIKALGGG